MKLSGELLIEEILTKRCVLEVDSPLYCCNPLTVVRGKKLLLVIDSSRSVNKNLRSCRSKYEGLPTLSEMFEKKFWFLTFDLESVYHPIDINPQFWQLWGFFRSLSIFTTRQIQSQKLRAVPLVPRVATICRHSNPPPPDLIVSLPIFGAFSLQDFQYFLCLCCNLPIFHQIITPYIYYKIS